MYEPKIEVVRASPMGAGVWNAEDGRYNDMERAYLVRGLPMPGELVRDPRGMTYVVTGICDTCVAVDGASLTPQSLTPHDPEAERLRVATEAVKTRAGQWWLPTTKEAEAIARAVLDALKEVGDA